MFVGMNNDGVDFWCHDLFSTNHRVHVPFGFFDRFQNMEITCDKGDHIVLIDKNGETFEGDVKAVNKTLGWISLKNIIQGNIEIEGYRHFDKDEIVEIKSNEIIERENCLVESSPERKKPYSLVNEVKKLPESSYADLVNLQTNRLYIRDLGTNFHSAISILKKCDVIGLCARDVSKGRSRRASLVAVSTDASIFLFDLHERGDAFFDKGLREILESRDIVKIVYDCRLLSDCFKHRHLTNIVNVRDVEAEDIMVVYQERKMIRKHSRSLDYLVKVYLGVELDDFYETSEKWDERPLPVDLEKCLTSWASILIPLQRSIEKRYMERLIIASNVYNNHVKNLDEFEFVHCESKYTLRKKMIDVVAPQNNIRSVRYDSVLKNDKMK